MTPYLSLYLLFSCCTLISYKKKSEEIFIVFFSLILILIIFSSLRYHVGGDWKRYTLLFNEIQYFDLRMIMQRDLMFNLVSIVSHTIIDKVFIQNIFLSLIFFLSLTPFLLNQKLSLLAITIFLPLGVFILHLGYVRQSVALSLLILCYFFIDQKRIYAGLLLFVISASFHLSSVIFFPLFIPLFFNKIFFLCEKYFFNFNLIFLLLIILIKCIAVLNVQYYQLFYYEASHDSDIYGLIRSYILLNESTSYGFVYRCLPSIFLVFIFFKIYNSEKIQTTKIWIGYNFILTIICFYLFLFGFSTLADRINFYLIPLQIYIFANYCYNNRTSSFHIKKTIFVLSMYFTVLFCWLHFSPFSKKNWQVYDVFL